MCGATYDALVILACIYFFGRNIRVPYGNFLDGFEYILNGFKLIRARTAFAGVLLFTFRFAHI